MKTSLRIGIGIAAGFIAGYFVGTNLLSAGLSEGSGMGDISKALKYSKNVVSPAMSAFQEKITSDTTEFNKTKASLTVLTSRMMEFDELVSIATIASEGKEELAASLESLTKVKQLASNARNNGLVALESLDAIAEGKKALIDYEQASQNLSLAYLMVNRQMNVGKQYVSDVDSFLRGKNVEEYGDLALARDLWAGYCAGEAVLDGDNEELDYWCKKGDLLTSDESGALSAFRLVNVLNTKFDLRAIKECIEIDRSMGLVVAERIGFAREFDFPTIRIRYAQAAILNCPEMRYLESEMSNFEVLRNFTPNPAWTTAIFVMPTCYLIQNITPEIALIEYRIGK